MCQVLQRENHLVYQALQMYRFLNTLCLNTPAHYAQHVKLVRMRQSAKRRYWRRMDSLFSAYDRLFETAEDVLWMGKETNVTKTQSKTKRKG